MSQKMGLMREESKNREKIQDHVRRTKEEFQKGGAGHSHTPFSLNSNCWSICQGAHGRASQ